MGVIGSSDLVRLASQVNSFPPVVVSSLFFPLEISLGGLEFGTLGFFSPLEIPILAGA